MCVWSGWVSKMFSRLVSTNWEKMFVSSNHASKVYFKMNFAPGYVPRAIQEKLMQFSNCMLGSYHKECYWRRRHLTRTIYEL